MISIKMGVKDIEALTGQSVVNFYEQGRSIIFVLANGMKIHVPKW
jgi:hypothetical protein